jgi:hypothetical protein
MKQRISNIFKTYVPAVVWSLIVLGLMCTPGKDLPDLGDWTELIKLDKWLHLLFFGMSAFFFMLPLFQKNIPKRQLQQRFLKISIAICIWGFCTECIQHFWVEGRTFDPYDAVADAVGAILAYFLAKKYLLHNKNPASTTP